MPTCKSQKYKGAVVALEYAIGCPDVRPVAGDWKAFAAMRTKEFELAWDTTDATADDSIGSLRENIATFQTMSISGDGVAKAAGSGYANLVELTKHVANPIATDGQPVVWLRMTFPDLTFTAFMLLSTMSRSAPYDDVVTFSMEASATASDFGLIVEDTPDPDAVPVVSVSLTPSPSAVTVGDAVKLTAAALPAEAAQTFEFKSSNTAIAEVTPTGHVVGIAAGTAVITATNTSDRNKTATSTVTVS